jgi:hypothetical protein
MLLLFAESLRKLITNQRLLCTSRWLNLVIASPWDRSFPVLDIVSLHKRKIGIRNGCHHRSTAAYICL